MRIAFFGTSDKSVPIIESINNNFNLQLCVTKRDTKVGRKQLIRETAVKKWAKKNHVEFMEISDIKVEEEDVIDKLVAQKIDLGIVADFSFIIPKKILQTPKLGLINLHFSLLPKLRGASPVQQAILQGLDVTGITYFVMDEGMDTGDILKQIEYKMRGKETSEELYKTLFSLATENFPEVVNNYAAGKTEPNKQDNKQATYCYSKTKPKLTTIQKDDARIDWRQDILNVERSTRAFVPWPIAWTTLGELEKNHKIVENVTLKRPVNRNLRVKLHQTDILDKKLRINKLQVEGKNIIDWQNFVNGYTSSA